VSVLDERMRRIAREELAGGDAAPADDTATVTELAQQVAALTTRVEELEKAAGPAPAAKRTARKTAESPE
jgi:hypothetical protein